METIIISGGQGFIGRALFNYFSKSSKLKVIGFDINPGNKVLHGDVRSGRLKDLIQRGSVLIHCASIAGVDNVLRNPCKCMDTIISGTMNMVNCACEAKVRKFINFSTSEVLGNTAFGKIVQMYGDRPLGVMGARAVYSNAKRAMENYSREMCKSFNLPMVNIRPFNVFGPGQKTGGAIFRLISQCLMNETMEIRNYGSQIRSWTYIEDMISAVELLINKKELDYEDVSVGNPANTLSTDLLARMIKKITKSKSDINYIDWAEEDIELRIPDISPLRRLGYVPKIDIERGIEETVRYYEN